MIVKCEFCRDILETPAWKQYFDTTVSKKLLESLKALPLVRVLYDRFGERTVYAYVIVFPKVIMSLSYPNAFLE